MGPEIIIAAISVVVSVLIYYAGVKRGEQQERAHREHERQLESERQAHERELESDRQRHERQLEHERSEQEMASRVADEYVAMVRRHYDAGPTAMARLGLDGLGSDRLIRQAIEEMKVRSNTDPWSGHAHHVEELDLVAFFAYVREERVNFFNKTVESVANQVRSAGVNCVR